MNLPRSPRPRTVLISTVIFIFLASLSAQSLAPPSLPGSGLVQHEFLYAGESHDRKIFLVRHGQIAWSYDDPGGKGEISDAVRLSNGNILFAHQFGVKLISPEKKVLWHYEPPVGHEVHTAFPIGTSRVLYIQNGDPALLRVVNIVSGAVEKEFPLPTRQPVSVHGQFRHARLTERGTLLVAHMDLNKVVEYDSTGAAVWSFADNGAWGVTPLSDDHVLITSRSGIHEVTRSGEIVWSWSPADTPDYKFSNLQQAWRLPNGNTVINNWSNEWNSEEKNFGPGAIQAIEITPAKQVVWALREWTPPNNLGPATTLQFLDTKTAPEAVHFGDIH